MEDYIAWGNFSSEGRRDDQLGTVKGTNNFNLVFMSFFIAFSGKGFFPRNP